MTEDELDDAMDGLEYDFLEEFEAMQEEVDELEELDRVVRRLRRKTKGKERT